jgi:hypothetical protein
MVVKDLILKLTGLIESGVINENTRISVPAQPDKDYDRTDNLKIIKDFNNGIIICDNEDSVFTAKKNL